MGLFQANLYQENQRKKLHKGNNMKFCVPSNWSDELLETISEYPVMELYGSLPETITGGGRPSKVLPNITFKDAEKHIRKVHEKNIQFDYLLNGSCFGNRETDPEFRKKLYEHIKWITDSGVDIVTVGNAFLLDFIKTHSPSLKVRLSIFTQVSSVATALHYESLGADAITLRQMENRDFNFLKKVREAVSSELSLLVNTACLYDCPYLIYHANASGHDSQNWNQQSFPANTYPIFKCSCKKITEPYQLIRSRWIRPEDLEIYEKIGYTIFKIAGRDTSTEWITNTLSAYAKRKYEGNLVEILDGLHHLPGWRKKAGNIGFKMPFIDNSKLDGFIQYFLNGYCDSFCHECDYCTKTAEKAIDLNIEENREFIEVIEKFSKIKTYV